jgi:hypothetical protein
MRLFQLLLICSIALYGQDALSDGVIQSAISAGRVAKPEAIWKEIEKRRSVKINRQSFSDSVGKTAVFLNDGDLISLVASDAARRHRTLTVSEVRRWPNLGMTHVLLVAVAGGAYIANLPKWQAPAVHMTITADSVEIQPISESGTQGTRTQILPSETGVASRNGNVVTYTPLYQSAIYDVARSRTWFSFQLPAGAKHLVVTVISADGHEKHKEFDGTLLTN